MPRHDAINLEAKSRLVMIRFLKKVFIDTTGILSILQGIFQQNWYWEKGGLSYWLVQGVPYVVATFLVVNTMKSGENLWRTL